jgi:seryl-tRNA synthetase
MLEVQKIREEWDRCVQGLHKRNLHNPEELLSSIVSLDDERKELQKASDDLSAEIKRLSASVGSLMKAGDTTGADALKSTVADKKEKLKEKETRHREVLQTLEESLLNVPNIPSSLVPEGKGPEDNEVYKDWSGNLDPKAGFLPHWEIADKLGIFDLKLGVKLAGSGFPVYRGKGAKLQRALINFFLEENIAAGYEEFMPPHLVNEETARATGQLPDKEGQMYHVNADNLYLIPTAEVPVTNVYRDVILQEEDFPIKMTAYTPCFRREAGSYGADVKGLNRVHQFDKVEIVEIAHPQRSYDRLQSMLAHVESLLCKLELPYRILRLCGGDMGFTSALTYDFEVFSIGQGRWLEVSSVSNFETYQSNRLKLRYKDKNGKSILAHTLNGSSLALPRILASLLECHQSEEGIVIPKALRPYTGFDKI